eukprot:SAG11_NODE_12537_length_698_cov_1.185309_1_plen_58_part_00
MIRGRTMGTRYVYLPDWEPEAGAAVPEGAATVLVARRETWVKPSAAVQTANKLQSLF